MRDGGIKKTEERGKTDTLHKLISGGNQTVNAKQSKQVTLFSIHS